MNPNKPSIHDDYTLTTVDPNWLQDRIKPRRHIALSPELCILCRACEDVCPLDCIYMLAPDIVKDGESPQLVTTLARTSRDLFSFPTRHSPRCGPLVARRPPRP